MTLCREGRKAVESCVMRSFIIYDLHLKLLGSLNEDYDIKVWITPI
jgi:hypothetical protein